MKGILIGTLILFLSGIINPFHLLAQEIRWADELEYEYNNYGTEKWSGRQVLGEPDARIGSLDENAFRIVSEQEFGTIVVTFNDPQPIQRVIVIESNEPGRITEVDITDVDNNRYTVFKSLPQNIALFDNRALVIPVNRNNVDIKQISVNLNTFPEPGWSQIDAIGVSDATEFETLEQLILEYGNYNAQEVLPFISEREHLGPKINTVYEENKPVISPQGGTLYFTRSFYPENSKGIKDELDIYYSEFHDEAWTEAVNIGEPLNDKRPNGVTSVSPDGNSLLLINAYQNRSHLTSRASRSYRTSEGWSTPETLVIDDYYNYSFFEDYYLAPSGEVLFTALERADTYGGLDLYICFSEVDGTWSAPVNLGPDINTSLQDFSPFLAPDGKTLYFASEGHGGFGQSDIFFVRRQDESWLNWSKPVNIGSAINTAGMDAYFSVPAEGNYAYFVSTNASIEGSRDIFRIKMPEKFKPEPVIFINGTVTDQASGEPVDARIHFQSSAEDHDQGNAITNPATGRFSIVLTLGKTYNVHIEAPGYISTDQTIDLSEMQGYEEVDRDIHLVPIQTEQVVPLTNIYFRNGGSSLMTESFTDLERFVSFLNENPSVEIQIQCYANGNNAEQLSQERCEEIRSFLVNRGIRNNRLQTKGIAASQEKIEIKILKI